MPVRDGSGLWSNHVTHLWMSWGSCSSWFPPMSSHSRAGSPTTQSGKTVKWFMDRSRCCRFFRFLN